MIGQGSHQELLAQNGVYAQLWAHQTGGFIGDDKVAEDLASEGIASV
nr:hypothetical protein [Vibrio xiamenensis]